MSITVAALALATPFTGVPAAPPLIVDSYRTVAEFGDRNAETVTITSPERFRFRSFIGQEFFLAVANGGTERVAGTPTGDGAVFRNQFAAQPDAFPRSGFDRYQSLVSHVVSQSRGGTLTLAPTSLAGNAALRVDVPALANDCAGVPSRTVRIWLSARTLLPLRVVERQTSNGAIIASANYGYRLINSPLPTGTFAPPPVGARPFRANDHFARTTPLTAAGPLPYTPRVPTVLPSGFTLATSGWAPRSAITGPEGSIGRFPWLFAATYRRGQERIDVTQRVSRTDWPDDPFGIECATFATEQVTVNGVTATFATGEATVPHLYWRDGPLLYTVSGPYPKDDLVAIAASLTKVGA
jgi:hypothetical protein